MSGLDALSGSHVSLPTEIAPLDGPAAAPPPAALDVVAPGETAAPLRSTQTLGETDGLAAELLEARIEDDPTLLFAQDASPKQTFYDARSAYERGDYEIALSRFQEIADDPSFSDEQRASCQKRAGMCLQKLGRYDEAVAEYEKALGEPGIPADERADLESKIAECKAGVGSEASAETKQKFYDARAAYERGDYENALARFKEIENDPRMSHEQRASCQNRAGLCLQKLGRYDEAVAEYEKALGEPGIPPDVKAELEGKIAECKAGVGSEAPPELKQRFRDARAAFERGDYRIALSRFEEMENDPRLSNEQRATIQSRAGRCQQELGEYDEAIASYEKALGDPSMPAAERADIERRIAECRAARAAP